MQSSDVRWLYDRQYFAQAVDGFAQFGAFNGRFESLFERYKRNVLLLDLQPRHQLLEVGCGRGEICTYHALTGGHAVGIDYSGEAIKLAREKAHDLGASSAFQEMSFESLSGSNGTYDRILASEFIEHISAEEGERFMRIAFDLLTPGGRMLVFTHPNNLQRSVGYPLVRMRAWLHGRTLPTLQGDQLSEHYRLYHLNEQNHFSLKRLAKRIGFRKIVVDYDRDASARLADGNGRARRWVMHSPLRHLFLTNLYLLAEK